MEMLRICHRAQLLHWKCIFTKLRDGGCRHLELRKSVASSLLLDQSSPKMVKMLRICNRTQLPYYKCIIIPIENGGGRHLEFRKSVAISSLWTYLKHHKVQSWTCLVHKTNCSSYRLVYQWWVWQLHSLFNWVWKCSVSIYLSRSGNSCSVLSPQRKRRQPADLSDFVVMQAMPM